MLITLNTLLSLDNLIILTTHKAKHKHIGCFNGKRMLSKLNELTFIQVDCICAIFHSLSTSWETLDTQELNS